MYRKIIKYAFYSLLVIFTLIGSLIGWGYFTASSTANDKWISFIYPSFYIKVLDQFGKPVKNTRIRYTNGTNALLSFGRSYGVTTTNDEGVARFYQDGRRFGIDEIYREGYHIDYEPQLRNSSDHPLRKEYTSHLVEYKKSAPLIIRAWKLNNLSTVFFGSGSLKLKNNIQKQISARNNINEQCLKGRAFSCTSKKSRLDENGPRLIQFRIEKADDEGGQKLVQNWSFTINIPSGGIIETEDLYLYKAPDLGYKSSWKKTHERSKPGDRPDDFDGRTHKFYIMFDQGQFFGRLYVKILPFRRDYSLLKLEYFVNYQGTTSLNTPLRKTGTDHQGIKSYFNYEKRY